MFGNSAASCFAGVAPAGAGNGILGGVFLTNVLAVFDWGNEVMSFGGREYYSLSA